MKNTYNLYSEINFSRKKNIFYKKKYSFGDLKRLIENQFIKLKNKQRGIVVLTTKNKLKFIIRFYALNRAGFKVLISNSSLTKKEALREKVKPNYMFKGNNLISLIRPKIKNNNMFDIILKTSGSTNYSKYVYLSNKNISFITTKMNEEMFQKKKINELIFSPIEHAFGFGRLHSMMKSDNSLALCDEISLSGFYKYFKLFKCNSASMPAKILTSLLEIDLKNFKNNSENLKYIQLSTGYFPLKYRRIIMKLKINLFINYGMTEAMRSTFLNCVSFPEKIHTEGRPFKEVEIKILRKQKSKMGSILVKGSNLAKGYSDKNLWKSKIKDGWFVTGDQGYLDKDGFLIFCGRDEDNININGVNYNLASIESDLKKELNTQDIKIINTSVKTNSFDPKIYLFIKSKNFQEPIIKFLKSNNINISFEKIFLIKKFQYAETGKIKTKNLFNLIKNYD